MLCEAKELLRWEFTFWEIVDDIESTVRLKERMMSKGELITMVSGGRDIPELHHLINTSKRNVRRLVIASFKDYIRGVPEEQCPDTLLKAWNAFRAGRQVIVVTPTCTTCSGRGHVTRVGGRGISTCPECRGTLHGRPVAVPVAAAPEYKAAD